METTAQVKRGCGKNKRLWTVDEYTKLVAALVDMVNIGTYKAENGFRPGYLTYLEQALKHTLPNSNLKVKPHIESHIRTLKGQFNIVYDMLNSPNVSGFGWDDTNKCLTAENSVWDAFLQNRPTYCVWKNKSFPYYEEFCVIFGKDCATGLYAEAPADVVSQINQDTPYEDGKEREYGDDIFDDDVFANNSITSMGEKSETPISRKSKKRNRSDDSLMVIKEAATIIGNEISKSSLEFSKAIGVEASTADKRQRINFELMKIELLQPLDRIKVLSYIAQNHELTDVFFSLNEKDREVMTIGILDGTF